jgi:hypothetical protein
LSFLVFSMSRLDVTRATAAMTGHVDVESQQQFR